MCYFSYNTFTVGLGEGAGQDKEGIMFYKYAKVKARPKTLRKQLSFYAKTCCTTIPASNRREDRTLYSQQAKAGRPVGGLRHLEITYHIQLEPFLITSTFKNSFETLCQGFYPNIGSLLHS